LFIFGEILVMTLPIGYTIVGRFEIIKVIAQGGFGIAYRAYDKNFHREVCIKELFLPKSQRLADYSVQTAAINGYDGSYFINNFLSEARKVANIRNENIVEVRDVFEANGTAYIVMEYINGISLSEKVNKDGPLNQNQAVTFFKTLCDAVSKLHSISLIHRDIKPDNILIEEKTNRLVLIDFGNAKEMHTGPDSFAYLSNGYSAIEQYSKESLKTFATDIYSIGATMYFALTGKQPNSSVDRISSENLVPPNAFNPSIKSHISNSIMKAMKVQVTDRYQHVFDFKNAFSLAPTILEPEITIGNPTIHEGDSGNNRKKWMIGGALLLLFVLILFVFIYSNKSEKPTADFSIPESVLVDEIITMEIASKDEDLTYAWEFEGANIETSEEKTPEIFFNNAGKFTIKLTVKNLAGEETTATKVVTVNQKTIEEEPPKRDAPSPVTIVEDEKKIEPETETKAKDYNCKLSFDGRNRKNLLSWNPELAKASNLKIKVKTAGGFDAEYDVTGTSSYVYNPQSAKADKYQTTFTLSTTDEKFILKATQLTESEVSCSAN
jgi:serine/threonine protein kinase